MKKIYLSLMAFAAFSTGAFSQSWTIYDNTNSNLGLGTYKAVEIDQTGKIWAGGSYNGVAFFSGSTWTRYTSTATDLVHDDVNDLEIDASNKVWIGTYKGISVYDGVNFTTYDTNNTVMNGITVYTLGKNTNNDIWIASRTGSFGYEGITVYNGSTWTNLTGYPSQIDGAEFSDFAFTSGTAWIASDPGITKYVSSFSFYPYATTGLWHSDAVAIDGSGNVWSGGFDGLLKYNGSSWTFTSNTTLGFSSNTFYYDILVDGNILWMGTSAGLIKYNTSTSSIVANYNSTNSPLDDNCVVDIEKDASGNLWLATTIGVVKLNPTGSASVDENQWSNLTLVYPNPSEGMINVSLPENYSFPAHAEVTDIDGKLIYSGELTQPQFTLDLAAYSGGIYFMHITNGISSPVKKKIILE